MKQSRSTATSRNTCACSTGWLNESPFVCDHCGRAYRSVGYLNNHLRKKHADRTEFVCQVCGLSFASSFNLELHAERHYGGRRCPVHEHSSTGSSTARAVECSWLATPETNEDISLDSQLSNSSLSGGTWPNQARFGFASGANANEQQFFNVSERSSLLTLCSSDIDAGVTPAEWSSMTPNSSTRCSTLLQSSDRGANSPTESPALPTSPRLIRDDSAPRESQSSPPGSAETARRAPASPSDSLMREIAIEELYLLFDPASSEFTAGDSVTGELQGRFDPLPVETRPDKSQDQAGSSLPLTTTTTTILKTSALASVSATTNSCTCSTNWLHEPPYVCDHCGRTYTYESNLRNHLRAKHADRTEFVCRLCGLSATSEGNLELHLARHYPDGSCPVHQLGSLVSSSSSARVNTDSSSPTTTTATKTATTTATKTATKATTTKAATKATKTNENSNKISNENDADCYDYD